MNQRSRCQLHHKHLDDFVAFCTSSGFTRVPTKGDYEVLRMKPPHRGHPLIVHTRADAKEHFTTWGVGAELANQFFRARRVAALKNVSPLEREAP